LIAINSENKRYHEVKKEQQKSAALTAFVEEELNV
jgi:hypothetical protein